MVLKQNKQLQNCQAHTWKGAELVMGEGKGSELLEVAQHWREPLQLIVMQPKLQTQNMSNLISTSRAPWIGGQRIFYKV